LCRLGIPGGPSATIVDAVFFETLIPAKELLIFDDVCGEGNFGTVQKGTMHGDVPVAVKVLKDQNSKARTELVKEAEIMNSKIHSHPNIVQFYGVVARGKDLCLVMELLESLKEYVKLKKEGMTLEEFIIIAHDSCKGMKCLHARGILHRDLGLRNLLKSISPPFTVKVSDFGLARSGNYYSLSEKSTVAPKWCAPEVLQNKKHGKKADVWAFGVTMWEAFAYGQSPYGNISTSRLFAYLQSGRRLVQPNNCPQHIWELISSCWHWDKNDRPTFNDLCDSFALLRQNN